MQNNYYKFWGWALCLLSLILLAAMGRLDLLIVLLPVSILVTILSIGLKSSKDAADGRRRKGIA